MIRCLAIDDEKLALDLLEDNILQVPFLQLVKRCKNAYEAMEVLQKEQIDLIFLDIQMPGITGMQFLQSLQSRPMVIFITAYKEYALDGFNLDVLDYLIKPVPFDRFLKATNKALEYHNLKQKQTALADVNAEYIFVNSEYNLVKVVTNEITYIEGLKDYIRIHQISPIKPVITRMSLKAFEEKLPSNKFIRVHKSFIVSVDKISVIRKNRIYIGEIEVPISDLYKNDLLKIINSENL